MSDNLINLTDIPANWQLTKISEIADVIMGQSPPSSTYNNEKIGLPFFQGKAEFTDLHPIIKKWCSEPNKISLPGDILISVRAPVGTVNIANAECCIGRGLSAIRYPECNKFLFYYFRLVERKLDEKGTGSTFRAISGDVIKNVSLFLPPLLEQYRIVAKIEALFSELDKGIECFKTAREQLKIYRQALLKHAFSGKLTEQWRAENQDKLETADALLQRIQSEREQHYQQQLKDWGKSVSHWDENGKQDKKPKKPRPLDHSVINNEIPTIELPSSWRWCNLGDIISDLTDYHANGSYETLKENVNLTDYPDFALMVRATNFEKRNFHSEQKYISKAAYEFLSKSKLFGNEILIGKIGNAGKVYFMPELHRPASLAMNLFCLRFNSVISKYIYFHLLTEFSKNQISYFVKGVGNPTIDKISIRSLSVALPSVEEQQFILNILEERFSIIDQLDQTLTTALQQVEALRQSILKKAFSGQLVPQDPNEEPASVLLERIQAEKATLVTLVRKRSKYA